MIETLYTLAGSLIAAYAVLTYWREGSLSLALIAGVGALSLASVTLSNL